MTKNSKHTLTSRSKYRIFFFLAVSLGMSHFSLKAEGPTVNTDKEVKDINTKTTPDLPNLPLEIPEPESDGIIYFKDEQGNKRASTLIPELQTGLNNFIRQNGNQIGAIVLADAKTGHLLAMAQGKNPSDWQSTTHTTLYSGFPAASIFKNVATAAAIDMAELDETQLLGLQGGCSHVEKNGVWLNEVAPVKNQGMSLSHAYGKSCNGFFAKIAVDIVGLGSILQYAKNFGWIDGISTDFQIGTSPMVPPKVNGSSIETVGRFAAGFGLVGLSPVHGAWFSVAMANNGKPMPLKLFVDTDTKKIIHDHKPLYSEKTGQILRDVMKKTTHGGTATNAFKQKRYKALADQVGGKTGTLTGTSPAGLTTWFTGMMPLDNPEVVVSAVTVAGEKWILKGSHLAAEGLRQWHDYNEKKKVVPEQHTSTK